jgi:hypothetical protein
MTTRIRVSKATIFKAVEAHFPQITLTYTPKEGVPEFVELEGEIVEEKNKCLLCMNCNFNGNCRLEKCPCHSKGTEERKCCGKYICDCVPKNEEKCKKCAQLEEVLGEALHLLSNKNEEKPAEDCNYGCNEKYQMVQCKVHNPKPVAPTKRKIEEIGLEEDGYISKESRKINEIIRFLGNEDYV